MNKIFLYISGSIMLLWLAAMVPAAGLSYGDNQVFPHGYIDYDRAGPLVLPAYPFGMTGRDLVFQTSYRQLYEIRELTDSRVALAVSRHRFGFGAAAALFGKPDYFQQLGLSVFARYAFDNASMGATLVRQRIAFNELYEAIGFTSANIGISYKVKTVRFFIVGVSVNQPAYHNGSERLPAEAVLGLSYKSDSGLDNQFKVRFRQQSQPSGELTQSLALSSYASLNWALVLRPVRFGMGVNLCQRNFGFEYKFSHHPVLGWTHQISLEVFK